MDATIYTKENCVFCTRAKAVLEPYNPKILKLDEDFNREQFFEVFPTAKTFPQIIINPLEHQKNWKQVIINGEKIGGFTELEQWMAFNKPDDSF